MKDERNEYRRKEVGFRITLNKTKSVWSLIIIE